MFIALKHTELALQRSAMFYREPVNRCRRAQESTVDKSHIALLRSATLFGLLAINMALLRSEEVTFARGSKAYRTSN
jgi:hypothetical protein